MKIIYVADDGKKFDNGFDCEMYEWKLDHPSLQDVRCYNKNNEKLNDIFAENTYYDVDKIIIPNDNVAKELQALGRYMGFSLYEFITESGEWVYDENKQKFVKR